MNQPKPAAATDHNLDLERAILAVLLDGRHKSAWATFAELCTPAMFYDRNHRLIALVCQWVVEEGEPLNAGSAAQRAAATRFTDAMDALLAMDGLRPYERAKAIGELDYADSLMLALGGYNALTDLGAALAPVGSLPTNLRHLVAYHRQRQLRAVLTKALADASGVDGSRRLAEIGERLLAALPEITGVATTTSTGTLAAAGRMALIDHDRAIGAPSDRTGRWGIGWLDERVPLAPGEIIVLAAAPGSGKTSLMLQAALATSKHLGPGSAAIASLEMPSKQLARVLLAREIGCSPRSIERGLLTDEQRARADVVAATWEAESLWMRDTNERSTAEAIAAWAKGRMQASNGRLAVLFLDYVQIIQGTKPGEKEYDRISYATGILRDLARTTGLCIVELSQMPSSAIKAQRGRDGKAGAIPEPGLMDLKGSGSIASDATGVVFLWNEVPDDEGPVRNVHCKLAKNRFGRAGKTVLQFHASRGQRFDDGRTSIPSTSEAAEPHHNTAMFTPPQPGEGAVFDHEGNPL